VEEARMKTENILKEAKVNADFLNQILSEKVGTPRDGLSVRSGLNSARRKFEEMNKEEDDGEMDNGLGDEERKSKSDDLIKKPILKNKMFVPCGNQRDGKIDGNDEFDLTGSVETPQIGSDPNSSLENTKNNLEGLFPKLNHDDNSKEPKIKHEDEEENQSHHSSEQESTPVDDQDLITQSLSRKKSEQRLSELNSKLPIKTDEQETK
jgi:hypothetical protein